jgi:hypothetical protein
VRERERERERRAAGARGDEPGAKCRTAMGAARPQHPPLLCARETAADGGRVWALRRNTTISGTEPRERESVERERERERDREEREREERESLFVCMYLCTCVCVYIYLLRIHIRYQGNAPIWKAVEFCSVLILTKPY